MANCINRNILNINALNFCGNSVPGISRLFVATYNQGFYSKLEVLGNQVIGIDNLTTFEEISINQGKYSETYNYNLKKYEQTFNFEVNKLDYTKRCFIDNLVKSKLIFIFLDRNGKWFLCGEKVGLKCTNYSASTDVQKGKNYYTFTFTQKSDYQVFGIDSDLIDNFIPLSNTCEFVVPGVNRLLIATFTDTFYNRMRIVDNQVVEIDTNIKFTELETNFPKYTENYNFETRKYEQVFNFEINKVDYQKRNYVDSLIKANLIFIFQDKNGLWYMLGEKSGLKSKEYNASTDVQKGKNFYSLYFTQNSDYQLFGVNKTLVDTLLQVDCTILDSELALTSVLYPNQFPDCLIGDLSGFVPY